MTDTPTTGTVHISVDESFKPVINEQIKVFESIHPEAKILVEYKAEADCLRDLEKDSTRMIIISRELNSNEIKYYKSKLKYDPAFEKVANDAIAIVINKSNPDSVFNYADLKPMLAGTQAKNTM